MQSESLPLVRNISDEELLQDMRAIAETEDRRRNRKHIREFVTVPVLNLVSLPIELENEPYAFIDTGLRPDVIGLTGFLFDVDVEGVSVRVGGSYRVMRHDGGLIQLPVKHSTRVSVPMIYDLYGIDIAYSYLKFLYERKYYELYPNWLALYLLGSLAVLQREVINENLTSSPESILLLCMRIMIILMDKDAKQIRMRGELKRLSKDDSLPSEIMAKITGSRRISNAISESVRAQRCRAIPTEDELHDANAHTDNALTLHERDSQGGSHFVLSYADEDWESHYWKMSLYNNDIFVLKNESGDDEGEYEQIWHAQFPIADYAWVFESRGCNPQSMIAMLRDLQVRFSDVAERDVMEACAWIVQLSSDTSAGRPQEFSSLADLRDELQRLLYIAISLYS